MKSLVHSLLFILSIFLAPYSYSINNSITVTAGTGGDPLFDEFGGQTHNELALLWVDTGDDGLQNIHSSYGSIVSGTLYGNDYLVGTGNTITAFGISRAPFSGMISSSPFTSQNDQIYVTWHNSPFSTTNFNAGSLYGVSTDAAWLLPSDGGSFVGGSSGNGGAMTFTIIPEPSTYAVISALIALCISLAHKRRSGIR